MLKLKEEFKIQNRRYTNRVYAGSMGIAMLFLSGFQTLFPALTKNERREFDAARHAYITNMFYGEALQNIGRKINDTIGYQSVLQVKDIRPLPMAGCRVPPRKWSFFRSSR